MQKAKSKPKSESQVALYDALQRTSKRSVQAREPKCVKKKQKNGKESEKKLQAICIAIVNWPGQR